MSLAEQLTRAVNGIAEAASKGNAHSLGALNDHMANLIQRVADLEKSVNAAAVAETKPAEP